MRYFFFVITLFISTFFYSQDLDLGMPNVTTKAEFPGGMEAFRKEFMTMVYGYVDVTAYAVNGPFSFIITIDEKGKMSELVIYPKVKNDEEFVQDMTFAMKRIRKKWKPATIDGKPISSNINFTNFTTDHADHGD